MQFISPCVVLEITTLMNLRYSYIDFKRLLIYLTIECKNNKRQHFDSEIAMNMVINLKKMKPYLYSIFLFFYFFCREGL